MEKLVDIVSINGHGVYRVQEGDTLDSIALKYSTTKAILVFDNRLIEEVSKGDILFIRSFRKVYTVTVYDTEESVSKKLNTTIEKIYELNKINCIYPYMRIVYEKDF